MAYAELRFRLPERLEHLMLRNNLIEWINEKLNVQMFNDYAPNGLQVEGSNEISKIISSVSASKNAIEYAIEQNADTLLVHHGMFWKSEPANIVGWKKQRIAMLLQNNINLLAYHLPLDAHPVIGNNAQLARLLDWNIEQTSEEYNLLNIGYIKSPQSLDEIARDLETVLHRKPLIIGNSDKKIQRIAWCSGAGQGFFQAAINHNVDAFITGEASESQYHLANETGVAFISVGHHASERYGVVALGNEIEQEFGVKTVFFDESNPI